MSDKMQEDAIREAARNHAMDEYFNARKHLAVSAYETTLFEAGFDRAWQAARTVPVMGEAVAEAYVYEDVDGDDILGLRLLKEDYPMQHGEKLYIEPTNSIPAAELATLREQAAMVDELQKRAERMQKALSDIAEWTDRYTTPGHPVSTIASAAIAQGKGE